MPSRRLPALCAVALALAVPAAAGAQGIPPPATPPAPSPAPATVKPGVTAAGIDLSGLTLEQATAKLDLELRPKVEAPFVLTAGGRRWTLTAKRAKLTLDSLRTAKRALYARKGTTAVPVALTHSRQAVAGFVTGVAQKLYRAPRNATVRVTLRRLTLTRSRYGKGLATTSVRKAIDAALDDPTAATRATRRRLSKIRAQVNANDARRAYRTVITIDKSSFRLRLFKDLKLRKSYGVAVGQPAYPTPSGLFRIQSKQVNPVWSVPNSPWAGELQGTTVEGGSAANPLKARWMGIVNGVGIHGTSQEYSIGSRASHGCIRMHVWDVKDLYERVPIGTPVLLA